MCSPYSGFYKTFEPETEHANSGSSISDLVSDKMNKIEVYYNYKHKQYVIAIS